MDAASGSAESRRTRFASGWCAAWVGIFCRKNDKIESDLSALAFENGRFVRHVLLGLRKDCIQGMLQVSSILPVDKVFFLRGRGALAFAEME